VEIVGILVWFLILEGMVSVEKDFFLFLSFSAALNFNHKQE
jgi:hypothetical protein